jgi:hypothetical protein
MALYLRGGYIAPMDILLIPKRHHPIPFLHRAIRLCMALFIPLFRIPGHLLPVIRNFFAL